MSATVPNATAEEKRLTAQEVHDLTEQALQAHFQLDMSDSPYEVHDIWDVVIAASVQRISLESGCDLLEGAPSANTVRTALKSLFSDEGLAKLEQQVNQLLVARLPKKLLNKPRIAASDITDFPITAITRMTMSRCVAVVPKAAPPIFTALAPW